MNKLSRMVAALVLPVMFGCSTTQVASTDSVDAEKCDALVSAACDATPEVVSTTPVRHLAWSDGDYQTDYEADRKIAAEKLQRFDGKIPEEKDTEAYLEYLSVLSGSGASDAERKIKKYLADHPNEKRAVFLLGVHYMRTKKKEIAQFIFAGLEKDPKFGWKSLLYNNLGMLALQDKNRPLALENFEKAVKAEPPTPAPLVNLGALYLQSRSWAEAEKLFARALDIDDDFEDAVLGLGAALEAQGKFEEAHKEYSEFIAAHSDASSVLFNDAIILGNRLKQREDAGQVMLRYIQRGGKETAKAHEIIRTWR